MAFPSLRRVIQLLWVASGVLLILTSISPIWARSVPHDYQQADVLEHTIKGVTVYSDRAEIQRSAQVKVTPGFRWFHFSDLPAELDRATLRVSVAEPFSGRISQVLVEERFEHKALSPLVSRQVTELNLLYAQRLDLQQRQILTRNRQNFIHQLRFDEAFDKGQGKEGYQPFTAPVVILDAALNELSQQSEKNAKQVQKLSSEIQLVQEQIDLKHKELGNASSLTDQKWQSHVYVLVEVEKPSLARFDLSYMIPKAFWKPIYDIRAELNRSKGFADIDIVHAGLVEQHTGEDWHDVQMTLSSLDPLPLYLPQLARWKFEEKREELPAPKNLAPKRNFADSARQQAPESLLKAEEERETQSGASPVAKDSTEAVAEAPASLMPRSRDHLSAEPTQESVFPLRALGELYSSLGSLEKQIESLNQSRVDTQIYQMSHAPGKPSVNHYSDPMLPAPQAGGRKLEMTSPFKVDLKSDEAALKLPLNGQRLRGKLEYFTIPKQDSRVFLRAETRNTSKKPILAGQSQIFMNGDLVSKSQLSTISEGAYFVVDLGVDENITTKRIVSKVSEEKGFVFKDHSTKVEVQIEVANNHAFPISLELKDHFPLSPVKDKIKIELLSHLPQAESVSTTHILRWKLSIPAKKKQVIKFTYRVSHPENYLVSEFN